jgi:8-oxo-dGTP pyrophosphatase MutT (NUDIX family)
MAAAREALEETGVRIKLDDLKHVHTMHRHHGDHIRVDVFFEAEVWQGEPVNNEPDVHSELAWFDANNLPYADIIDWQAAAIKHIINNEPYSEIGWAEIAQPDNNLQT